MNERIRSEARKMVLATTALAGAVLFTSCEDSRQNNPTPTPPEGFSRKINDYKYRIVIDIRDDYFFTLYTNNEPTLDATGGQNLLIAQDVYCPDIKTEYSQKEFNCNKFVEGIYKLASPKRIIVAPNPQKQ